MLKLNKGYKRVAVITAVILIPLVYSFFYLYAFWDPYSKLKDLPVALVNEDKGALISGSSRNAGKEIVEELKKDESLKWIETDRNEAKNGLNNRRYYAEILIPQNFSQEISTADKADKKEGLLIYTVNEKRNFLAGQVLNRGMLELKDKISRKITGEIVDNIVIEVKKLPDNLKTMEDKLGEAEEGAGKLSDGISELQKNQLSFNNGILKLKNGVMDLSIGSNKLSSGQKELFNGLSSGSVDIRKLADGSNQFSLKLSELNSGTVKLNEGASGLKEGSAALNSGLSALNSSINSPNGGLLDFANGASNFGKGLQSFGEGFSSIKGASQSMYDGM